jgi:hypothetical protein
MAELLDVPYAHLVFMLPHELNALAGGHPRWAYEAAGRRFDPPRRPSSCARCWTCAGRFPRSSTSATASCTT